MPNDEEDTPTGPVSYDDLDDDGNDTTAQEADTDSEADSGDSESKTETEASSISDVETIVLEPDDVVRTVAYNGQEDVGLKGKAVFSLTPPFETTVEPTIRHLEEDSTDGKADEEIHIRPFRFVMKGRQVIEQRPTRQLAKEELDGDEPDEEAIEAWIDEAMETWRTHVRENLSETVDIYTRDGMSFIDVEYHDEE